MPPTTREKGRAGGWYQAGNLGGQGIGGGAALWIAQHIIASSGCPARRWRRCSWPAAWRCSSSPEPRCRSSHSCAISTACGDVAVDVWNTAKSRAGYLALLICFLPIGSGAASNLWSAVAGDWHADADTVALVNGVLGGMVSAIGCVIGGYLCDRMDRKFAYCPVRRRPVGGHARDGGCRAHRRRCSLIFTLLYAFIQGFNYASFSAVVLEAIGRGAAATKYNIFASLSNLPIAYMTHRRRLGL